MNPFPSFIYSLVINIRKPVFIIELILFWIYRMNTNICTYDNPATMCRECWQDGKLICSYSYTFFSFEKCQIPVKNFFFGANIGIWIEGQIIGNSEAIGSNY